MVKEKGKAAGAAVAAEGEPSGVKRTGRPRKAPGERRVNPNRFVGRWSDDDWAPIIAAAAAEGLTTVEWVRRTLTRAAARKRRGAKP